MFPRPLHHRKTALRALTVLAFLPAVCFADPDTPSGREVPSVPGGVAETMNSEDLRTDVPSTPQAGKTGIYVHGGGGAGFAIMSSDELTELFGDEFGIGLGLHFSASVAVGYENLFQLELRRGDSAHTLRDNNIVTNETTEIPMDYDFTEYVFKANLFAISKARRANKETALFLIAGTSDIEYQDESEDGFKGSATVLGFEYTRFAPRGSVTVGIRRYGIEFDRITLLGQTGQLRLDASNYVLHTAVSFGFGI